MKNIKYILIKLFGFNKIKSNEEHIEKEKNDEEIIKRKKFDNVKVGETVIAKTQYYNSDDLDHLYRPHIIVGRTEDELYGLMATSVDKTGNVNYYKNYNAETCKVSFVKCSNIYKLDIDDYKYTADVGLKVSNVLLKKIVRNANISKVDKNLFLKYVPIEPGSVIVSGDNYFFLTKKLENGNYKAYRLIRSSKNYFYLTINNINYEPDFKSDMIININDIDYAILSGFQSFLNKINREKKELTKVCEYTFGDIISLKGSNEKIIYITSRGHSIYYTPIDSLELFLGISGIKASSVSTKVGRLSDLELRTLIQKIDKGLSNEDKTIPNNIKKEVSVLVLKKK